MQAKRVAAMATKTTKANTVAAARGAATKAMKAKKVATKAMKAQTVATTKTMKAKTVATTVSTKSVELAAMAAQIESELYTRIGFHMHIAKWRASVIRPHGC